MVDTRKLTVGQLIYQDTGPMNGIDLEQCFEAAMQNSIKLTDLLKNVTGCQAKEAIHENSSNNGLFPLKLLECRFGIQSLGMECK